MGYLHYLNNFLNEVTASVDTPVKIEFKGRSNPLAERNNTPSRRQQFKRLQIITKKQSLSL